MKMADIRAELHDLADKLNCPCLHDLAEATRRRKRSVRTPPTSKKMTPELADEIREYRLAHPDMAQHEVAAVFNVSPGRVNEVMIGKKS